MCRVMKRAISRFSAASTRNTEPQRHAELRAPHPRSATAHSTGPGATAQNAAMVYIETNPLSGPGRRRPTARILPPTVAPPASRIRRCASERRNHGGTRKVVARQRPRAGRHFGRDPDANPEIGEGEEKRQRGGDRSASLARGDAERAAPPRGDSSLTPSYRHVRKRWPPIETARY